MFEYTRTHLLNMSRCYTSPTPCHAPTYNLCAVMRIVIASHSSHPCNASRIVRIATLAPARRRARHPPSPVPRLGVSGEGCVEKSDLIRRLGSAPGTVSPPPGFRSRSVAESSVFLHTVDTTCRSTEQGQFVMQKDLADQRIRKRYTVLILLLLLLIVRFSPGSCVAAA